MHKGKFDQMLIPLLEPESTFHRLMLDTPILRKIGRLTIATTVMRSGDGLRIMVRPSRGDRKIAEELLSRDLYEKYYTIKQGDIVIDVGAHIGSFTLKAGRKVRDKGKVFALEPTSDNFKLLEKNILLNGFQSICTPINAGAGSSEKKSKIRIYAKSGADSFFARQSDYGFMREEEVNVITLDSIAVKMKLDRVDFVKINVEGFELEVLNGARNILKNFHPKLALQVHEFAVKIDALTDFLRSSGYELKPPVGDIYFAE